MRASRGGRLLLLLAAGVGVAIAGGSPAQAQLRERTLEPAASFGESFSSIRAIRELADRRLILTDQLENAIYLVDLAAGTRTTIGSNGPGPEEYDQPIHLTALRGDTTLVSDFGNGRWSWLLPTGLIGRSFPLHVKEGWSLPRDGDRMGRLYWDGVTAVRLKKNSNPSDDSAPIIRGTFPETIDTIGQLNVPGPRNPGPIPTWDVWTVDGSGRIAIARNGPEYRVEWISPDGRVTRGEAVPFEPVRVTAADREAYQAGEGPQGGGTMSAGARGAPPRANRPPLPDRFPPVKYNGVWISHDGRAWVERHQSIREKRPLLDVFDSAGRRIAIIRLPANRKVIDFGPSGLYAVRIDDVGLQFLERYDIASVGR